MGPEKKLGDTREHIVRQAMAELAERGCFSNPPTVDGEIKMFEEVCQDLPGFAHLSDWMVPVLMECGWTEDEVGLLVSGVDMALMVVHEVIAKSGPEASSAESAA